MYATIRMRERGTTSTDELARAGHTLAARMGMMPGFIAFLLLEMPGDGCAVITIVEERAGLAAADDLVAGWSPDERPAPWTGPPRQLTGEVIVQKGL